MFSVGNLSFDNVLSSDTGMVHTRNPEDVITAHPFPAHQYVLYGSIEGMPHMQSTGNIRGGITTEKDSASEIGSA